MPVVQLRVFGRENTAHNQYVRTHILLRMHPDIDYALWVGQVQDRMPRRRGGK